MWPERIGSNNDTVSKTMPAGFSKYVPSLVVLSFSICVPRGKMLLLLFLFSFSKNGSPFSLKKCKVPLHLETFPFGEKIRVSEKPSNPRAQISLDEWL